MGNNAAAGHMINFTGLPQAAGFHRTLGQMMHQYSVQPWDPRPLLQTNLQRQQELQSTSPFRFIQVGEGLQFYGKELGMLSILNREKFVQMSLQLFQQKGLHIPSEEARVFYDVFDSIDLYRNAQLSVGELAGGLSSMFGGTVDAKTNAVFDLLAKNSGQVPKSAIHEFIKPYVWCMVPPNAEVLRPILLPHVVEEIYNDMTFGNSGHITRQEMQRWMQKGQLSQGQVAPDRVNMSLTVIDRAAIIISMALQVAWREYDEKYKLQDYGAEKWKQNYGNQPQQFRDVGAYRYARQYTPSAATTAIGFAQVGQTTNTFLQNAVDGIAGATAWISDSFGGRRDSEDSISLGGTQGYEVASPCAQATSPTAPSARLAFTSFNLGGGLPQQEPRTAFRAPPLASQFPFATGQPMKSGLHRPTPMLSQDYGSRL